ncbi:carboxypeptidase-like regulatory domain-containing protein [Nocardiopsis synnemataformans]|uniref:carboxypeptidase-like regulatory domain-containing protein n=1 Tax=Nocardiopsis synnemataformans TaxID=61305 RepID=UPI003EBD1240
MTGGARRLTAALAAVLLGTSCAAPGSVVSNEDPPVGTGESRWSAVTGTVRDSSGEPVEGVFIRWSSNEDPVVASHEMGVSTVADGSYRLSLLPGSWDLHGVRDNGARTGTETVVLGEDDVTVDLRFAR